MGGAVLNGLLKNGFSAGQIRVAEPNETVRSHLKAKGIVCAASASELADFTPDIVFLAVKPFLIEQIIGDIKPFTDKGAAVLSIIAGRRIEWFKEKLGKQTAVFRAMPNTPAAIWNRYYGRNGLRGSFRRTKTAGRAYFKSLRRSCPAG